MKKWLSLAMVMMCITAIGFSQKSIRINDDNVFSLTPAMAINNAVDSQTSDCDAPVNLVATPNSSNMSIALNWEMPPSPSEGATVILEAHDVWGDGSGYQLLLDADANEYGYNIPDYGIFALCTAQPSAYNMFEYKIPTNADPSCTTSNIILDGTESIVIPAGIYDFCVINPQPGQALWIAGGDYGRGDDLQLQAGYTYHFTVTRNGAGDNVAMNSYPTRSTSDNNSFNIYRDGTEIASGITTMNYTDNNLSEGIHCYTVKTVCANGLSNPSNEDCAYVGNGTCGTTVLTAEESEYQGNIAILLSWEPVEDAIGYTIYYGSSALGNTSLTSVHINGLLPGNTYCFTVTAYCQSGEGEHSNEACVTLGDDPCNPPTNLIATGYENNVELSWTAVSGVIGYRVFCGNEELEAVMGTTFTHTGLTPGQYCYSVSTICNYGESGRSEEACATVGNAGPCTAPTLTGEQSEYNGQIAVYLQWNAIQNASTYNIYYGTTLLGSTPETDVYITGLEAGQTYCFNVTALCTSGESNPSNEACVTMSTEQEPCDTPTNLVATAAGTTAQLVWNAVEGATGYKVFEGNTEIATVSTNSFHYEELIMGNTYCFTVKTLCENDESETSEEACVTIIAINELEHDYSVFPNPANAQIFVRGENIKRISVYNIIGQMIDSLDVTDSETVINANHYEEGMYLIRITTTDGNVISKRVVIAR